MALLRRLNIKEWGWQTLVKVILFACLAGGVKEVGSHSISES